MMSGDTKILEELFSPSFTLAPLASVQSPYLGLDITVNQLKGKHSLTDIAQCPFTRGVQLQTI